ncbi:uncharacterized protein LOC124809816 [Hydra vulgaris]|uniref:uncharacterized protein LOC124809816 n=1 Tax=Hydra vulgaris TaxID=6087 RepID=UPI0032EA8449
MNITDDFNINQEDYSYLLENIDSEIEIVVDDFMEVDLNELVDFFSEDLELELIPSAIPTEKSISEEELNKLKKKDERLTTKFTCPKCQNKYIRQSNFKKHEMKCYIGTKDNANNDGATKNKSNIKEKTGFDILCLFILKTWFQNAIEWRNHVLLESNYKELDLRLTPEEEETVRYVAGFIPFSLRKMYSNRKDTDLTKAVLDLIKSWESDSDNKSLNKTFLEYTRGWTDRIN